MRFVEVLKQKIEDNPNTRTPMIAFLGDSVTQGCFEVYQKGKGFEVVFDSLAGYSEKVKKLMALLYPKAPISILNFGVNGSTAPAGYERLMKDVLPMKPDLLVVCFGLNDSNGDIEGIDIYKHALKQIFKTAKEEQIETIFMTPNMMNTEISPHLAHPDFVEVAEKKAALQNGGIFDRHIEAARSLCAEMSVPVCDCYAIWKMLSAGGVNTTELLSNRINHPTSEMHKVFAYELVKTMFEK
jgi:lysophospholipase L1-like esterase